MAKILKLPKSELILTNYVFVNSILPPEYRINGLPGLTWEFNIIGPSPKFVWAENGLANIRVDLKEIHNLLTGPTPDWLIAVAQKIEKEKRFRVKILENSRQ